MTVVAVQVCGEFLQVFVALEKPVADWSFQLLCEEGTDPERLGLVLYVICEPNRFLLSYGKNAYMYTIFFMI